MSTYRRRVYAEDKLASFVFDNGSRWCYFRAECGMEFNWPFDEKASHAVIDPETDECIGIRSYGRHLTHSPRLSDSHATSDVPVMFRVYLLRPLLLDVETPEERAERHKQQGIDDAEVGSPLTLEGAKDLLAVYISDKAESRMELEKKIERGEASHEEMQTALRISAQCLRASLEFRYNNNTQAAIEYLKAELELDPNDKKAKQLLVILGALTS